jgi:hypothetical protein
VTSRSLVTGIFGERKTERRWVKKGKREKEGREKDERNEDLKNLFFQ